MKRHTGQWVRKAEDDWDMATTLAGQKKPRRDGVCFHCQQMAEKYLKALLQEISIAVPKTHNLRELHDLLLAHDASLAPLRRGLKSLTRFAVDYRYPGLRANTRQMRSALRNAHRVRRELRARLGLPS
jgi:HEPN domain-containing protein